MVIPLGFSYDLRPNSWVAQPDRDFLGYPYFPEPPAFQLAKPQRTKYAVLSMDVEDWYHTGYLREQPCDRSYSMLDGLDQFLQVLDQQEIQGQFFVLGELLHRYPQRFQNLQNLGHDIASHGWGHQRPSDLSLRSFTHEMRRCQGIHEDVLGTPLHGFRAPCFGLDRARLNALIELGFQYDSSSIQRPNHSPLDLYNFQRISENILQQESFFEFQLSNYRFKNFSFPTSGGGAMRILPWGLTQAALKLQLKTLDLYSLYIHPIDLSQSASPPFPQGTSRLHQWRFNQGRRGMARRLQELIVILKRKGYQFITYAQLRALLLVRLLTTIEAAVG
jgi:peptidoglycan/xylan/chitin deacetylase (PgdA/CDA1 family)